MPTNLHASPCLQGQETPQPLWAHSCQQAGPACHCWTLSGITRLRSRDVFLHRRCISEQRQLSTGKKSSPHVYRESPNEFACIKLEQNTNQHEMQQAEVFLSHVHTHTQSTAGQHTFDRQDSGNPVLATRFFLYSRLKYKEEHSDSSPLTPQ